MTTGEITTDLRMTVKMERFRAYSGSAIRNWNFITINAHNILPPQKKKLIQ
jgi:hypothetical protein